MPDSSPANLASLKVAELKLQVIIERLRHRLGCDIVTLYCYDPLRDLFYLPVGVGLQDVPTFRYALPRSDRIAGHIAKECRIVVADDVHPGSELYGPFSKREGVASAAGGPIGQTLPAQGVLFVNFRSRHVFTAEDLIAIKEAAAEASETLVEVPPLTVDNRLSAPAGDEGLQYLITSSHRLLNAALGLWLVTRGASEHPILVAAEGLGAPVRELQMATVGELGILAEALDSSAKIGTLDLTQAPATPLMDALINSGQGSAVAIPVMVSGHIFGILGAFRGTKEAFASSEIHLLEVLATQAGDRLTEQRHARAIFGLQGINAACYDQGANGMGPDTAEAIAQVKGRSESHDRLEGALKLIVVRAKEAFGADSVTLYPYYAAGAQSSFEEALAIGLKPDFFTQPYPEAGSGAARLAAGELPHVYADDATTHPDTAKRFVRAQGIQSLAGVPLRVADDTVGVLYINYLTSYHFTDDDKALLRLFAAQSALVIKTARHFEEQWWQSKSAEITNSLSQLLEQKSVFQALAEAALDLTAASTASIFVYNEQTKGFERGPRVAGDPQWQQAPARVPRAEQGLASAIFKSGEPILVQDTVQDERVRNEVREEGTRAILGVRMMGRNRPVGVLFVSSDRAHRFRWRHAALLQELAHYGAAAIERTDVLEAVKAVNGATAAILGLEELVKEFLSRLVYKEGFEFAALQLVDRERNVIETVDGINAPWGAEARHSLDSNDIQADIVRTGRCIIAGPRPGRGAKAAPAYGPDVEVIQGYDSRFDRSIYDRFRHRDLIRAILPLRAPDEVLGTIEVGSQVSSRQPKPTPDPKRGRQTISARQFARLRELVAQYQERFEQATLSHMLQVVVSSAMRMVHADSGSIHVLYNPLAKRYIHEEVAGRIGREFLDRCPPRRRGFGRRLFTRKALAEGQRLLVCDDPDKLASENPRIYGEGVRAIACVAIARGSTLEGVLYIHHWDRPHKFSPDELHWLEILADQATAGLQNAQFYRKMRDRSGALTSLSVIGQTLVGEVNLESLLSLVANSARDVLRADIVTIYRYEEDKQLFRTPPTIQGDLWHPGYMLDTVEPGDAQWQLVHARRQNFYAPEANQRSVLYDPVRKRPDSKGRPFVEREGIASSAGILLELRGEIVGVMFTNYRVHHDFADSERRVIESFASYAAIAIHTTRQSAEKQEQLIQLQNHLRSIAALEEPKEALQGFLETFRSALDADDALLIPYDAQSDTFDVRGAIHVSNAPILRRPGRPKRGGLSYRVLQEDWIYEPNLDDTDPALQTAAKTGLLRHTAARAFIGARLQAQGDASALGVLFLDFKTPQQFSDRELALMRALADRTAMVLQTARFAQAQRSQLREQVAAEIRRRFNPYQSGNPIRNPKDFYGRRRLLEQILSGIAKNNYIIYGQRRIGKTSILNQLFVYIDKISFENPNLELLPVQADLSAIAKGAFYHTLMSLITTRAHVTLPSLHAVRDKTTYDHNQFAADIEAVVEEMQAQLHGRAETVVIVLLLDEMDWLAAYGDDFNAQFRSVFNGPAGAHVKLVLAGVSIQRAVSVLSSPWFNLFVDTEVGPLEMDEARRLIEEPIQGYYAYEDGAQDAIMVYTDCRPNETQLVCLHAINAMLDRISSSPATQEAIITQRDVRIAIGKDQRLKGEVYESVRRRCAPVTWQRLLEIAAQDRQVFQGNDITIGADDLAAIALPEGDGRRLVNSFITWLRKESVGDRP